MKNDVIFRFKVYFLFCLIDLEDVFLWRMKSIFFSSGIFVVVFNEFFQLLLWPLCLSFLIELKEGFLVIITFSFITILIN